MKSLSRLCSIRDMAVFLLLAFGASGCQTVPSGGAGQRDPALEASIRAEEPGNYFIARRFYKQDYKMWGWVRKPGQMWSTAQLVMLNEQKMLAPDRQQNRLGSDNNYEYKLLGFFSGETVYEPASNHFYPEFVLIGSEVRSMNPPVIFKDPRSTDPTVRLLTPPM